MKNINVIITGSTGMVGKGVLLECLDHDQVASVLVINRSSVGIQHSKLKEVILNDFSQVDQLKDQLVGYDACFFCLGISAVGMSEEKYTKITYDLTINFAQLLSDLNPEMTFNYVSGTGTDSREKSRQMWARVKGKTENDLLKLPFRKSYMFRPGFIVPKRSIKSKTPLYNAFYVILKPLLPLLERTATSSVTTTTKVGMAMINSILVGYHQTYLENKDINALAEQS